LAAASLLLVVACVAAIPLMQADQRQRKLRDRVDRYASPYARATIIDARETTSSAPLNGRRLIMKTLTHLVGFDPSHKKYYPLPWWLLLPIALGAARVLVALAQTMLGATALLLLPAIWILLIRQFYRWCERRRIGKLFGQFPDALAMLVRAVRVGIPITEGMRNVAVDSPDPTGPEFTQVVDQLTLGVTLDQALQDLAARNDLPEYGFFATALALQAETGGTVSDTLDRLAEVIRKRVALREHARALASEARTSIAILAALPIFTGVALALLKPDYIATLFTDPLGQRVFAAAIISLSTGILTMRTIVNRSLS
jgi:tight adherence protein B